MVALLLLISPACNPKPAQPEVEPPPTNVQVEVSATATISAISIAISDDQVASSTLVEFFEHLNAGRYEEAGHLYAGTYQIMIDQNPAIDPQDHVALLRNACTINGFQCLQIRVVGIDRKPSHTEYIFGVQFQNNDGSLFVLETEAATMPISFFEIKVIKTPQSEFCVMDMPPYMP